MMAFQLKRVTKPLKTRSFSAGLATSCSPFMAVLVDREGALGSFMLRSYDPPEKVLTIAKWNTREDWERFWENRNPEKMQKMREIAERISVEPFDEIEDRTK
ncbi:hypothetical protein Mar181_2275 [Marinomonas posidonica IVIA-Po-181]|uniref:ABM domain-containing protein n=2 Tax=Marinomonas TaxID=28253 RepID=F6CUY5_MARPP|nr:hypothetical protein Mar181_2275 [Marinomonas posidonica IVIA-Po-181]